MNELDGKVAIITGAASGIGRAAARRFAEEGARLLLADRDDASGRELAGELAAGGAEVDFQSTDVADPEHCARLVDAAMARFGRLDCAFNNAGISDGPSPPGTVDYPLDLWHRIIAVNLSGVFYCMRQQLRAMLRNGGGAIVNTASVAGQAAFPGIPGYVASKHGVVGLTKCVALEYAARGVRCNVIAPGVIDTPMTQPVRNVKEAYDGLLAMIPQGRMGTAAEVANVAVWLCSDRASYVNGAVVAVDGAWLAR